MFRCVAVHCNVMMAMIWRACVLHGHIFHTNKQPHTHTYAYIKYILTREMNGTYVGWHEYLYVVEKPEENE